MKQKKKTYLNINRLIFLLVLIAILLFIGRFFATTPQKPPTAPIPKSQVVPTVRRSY